MARGAEKIFSLDFAGWKFFSAAELFLEDDASTWHGSTQYNNEVKQHATSSPRPMDKGTHQNKHLDLQRHLVANAQPLFHAMGNDDDANDDANTMSGTKRSSTEGCLPRIILYAHWSGGYEWVEIINISFVGIMLWCEQWRCFVWYSMWQKVS